MHSQPAAPPPPSLTHAAASEQEAPWQPAALGAHPSAPLLASCGVDRTLRLWDLQERRQVRWCGTRTSVWPLVCVCVCVPSRAELLCECGHLHRLPTPCLHPEGRAIGTRCSGRLTLAALLGRRRQLLSVGGRPGGRTRAGRRRGRYAAATPTLGCVGRHACQPWA
eukprot:6823206-Prymnesium_polylepis.1